MLVIFCNKCVMYVYVCVIILPCRVCGTVCIAFVLKNMLMSTLLALL